MSWLADEWKNELPMRALRHVEEIEQQLERLKKDNQQKQFRVDNLEQVRLLTIRGMCFSGCDDCNLTDCLVLSAGFGEPETQEWS